jgi:hypothetical protein
MELDRDHEKRGAFCIFEGELYTCIVNWGEFEQMFVMRAFLLYLQSAIPLPE